MIEARDHGGGLDAAVRRHGGSRADWIDLSTGINPVPYPVEHLSPMVWTDLPDEGLARTFEDAAREFWRIPDSAGFVAAPGASALIARLPALMDGDAHIPGPTYNEHAAAFGARATADPHAPIHVYVHPNNPDGRQAPIDVPARTLTVFDESFCDTDPASSRVPLAVRGDVAVLKSFGKFWGLAGLRLGALIASPALAARMRQALGPWPVSGPALAIGARALADHAWADRTRVRLTADAARLDALVQATGATCVGGTPLFRLYAVESASVWQDRLARHRIWSRIFPYNSRWLRLGLPPPEGWTRLEQALGTPAVAGNAAALSSTGPGARQSGRRG